MIRITLVCVFALVCDCSFAQSWPAPPDHTLTPGKVRNISLTTICNTTWGSDAPALPWWGR
jgi:hypothetical protein